MIKYFKEKGIEARLSSKTDTPNPDFELYFDDNLFAYCELKSIMPYELEIPSNITSGQIYEDEHHDPAFNTIQSKIHEACKQLRSVNPNHVLPNIIFFINHHHGRGIPDLRWVITGQVSREVLDVLDLRYLKRLQKDLPVVDYFIWVDSFSNKAFYYFRSESSFKDNLREKISSKEWEILTEPLFKFDC